MAVNVIRQVRESRPLIHNMTNAVVMNFTANGLLAFGGTPIMSHAMEDAPDVARQSSGLLLNIGTLTEDQVQAMISAGQIANDQGIPVVFDPVGAGATPYRSEVCKRILKHVRPTVIKGNSGELAHLVGIDVETKGVDSVGEADEETIVRKLEEKYRTSVLCTGAVDVLCIEGEIYKNHTGHPVLTQVTGAGCLLGSLLTAALTVEASSMEKGLAVLEHYGKAAERAANQPGVHGPGTFIPHFIDALSFDPEELRK
ncbi:hydroxyethylthiazole kinase [Halobacillus litoralis]|uniref:hydroxyethylthiazole kinase n=1 Tax=Halobacillus litoralis TaxID=45668 RepID=UPI002492E277|nr:hydroxyethylthiazole kinase [Halobacillus litoralis]